jgi:hypothetical protein
MKLGGTVIVKAFETLNSTREVYSGIPASQQQGAVPAGPRSIPNQGYFRFGRTIESSREWASLGGKRCVTLGNV